MDVETTISWAARPRKGKRTCEYLQKNRDAILCLPAPSIFNVPQTIKREDLSLDEVEPKKLCFSVNKNCRESKWKTFYQYLSDFLNPALIIGALHVIMNLFLISVLVYSVCYILYFAKMDISYKIGIKQAEARAIVEEAKRMYKINKCDPTTRVPALEAQCGKWECIIKSGFSGIKYTRIVAELFADVVDGFVGRFKLRNLIVIMVFVATTLIFRRKSSN
ncbi:uncharacterized protein VICG_01907 [Vittaforma corneae ATCC 50505]|uniref:Brl1/Brr6 domain-containing protein n=1 Tax=Vittaforma corneae (strain ATCC 50505) TaxID=993615 RepID=L2GKJ0_VITCO|nr:uncharacterized protein VICG_01907 [Vittaforma corneae ATCC 50505]ELA41025.1 hypothetical protein VICG_01907 [Vittaforma corneae ATCC 50505]